MILLQIRPTAARVHHLDGPREANSPLRGPGPCIPAPTLSYSWPCPVQASSSALSLGASPLDPLFISGLSCCTLNDSYSYAEDPKEQSVL